MRREVGPERLGDVQFRVGDLPEQEIADAHLAGRADQQIGIGTGGGVEAGRDQVFVDLQASMLPSRRAISRMELTASTISARPP